MFNKYGKNARLFTDTEFGENSAQQVIAGEFAGNRPQRTLRHAKFLREDLAGPRIQENTPTGFEMPFRFLKSFDMPLPRGECSLAKIAEAGDLTNAGTQRIDASTCLRRHVDDRGVFVHEARGISGQVHFVPQCYKGCVFRDRFIERLIVPFRGVADPQHRIGVRQGLPGTANALCLDGVGIFTQTGRIDQLDSESVDLDCRADPWGVGFELQLGTYSVRVGAYDEIAGALIVEETDTIDLDDLDSIDPNESFIDFFGSDF